MRCSWSSRRTKQTGSRSIGWYVQVPLYTSTKMLTPILTADSARATAHHRNRRNRHATHRLPPTPQQLQPKRRPQCPTVPSDPPSQIRRQWRQNRLLDNIRAPRTQVLPSDALGSDACEPSRVDRKYHKAAGSHARTESILRDECAFGGVFPECEPSKLRYSVQ
jgi:hypothetical protein